MITIRTALVLALLAGGFLAWLRIEDARELQCRQLTTRAGMPWRYTLLEGCQVQHDDGIWRSAISIDLRGGRSIGFIT